MRVVLIDDHVMVRRGLRQLLSAYDIEVAGDFGPSEDVLERAYTLRPDVLILDLSMPGRSGVELLAEWKGDYPEIPVLVLTLHVGEPWVGWAINAGADGYLCKTAEPEELIAGLQTVAAGGRFIGSENGPLEQLEEFVLPRLTRTEREVLIQVGRGAALQDLAVHFSVTRNTAKTHLHNLYRKFGVSDRAQLLLRARSLGAL